MVAVPLPCNGHYGSFPGALRKAQGRGRREGSVQRSFGARKRRGRGTGVHGCRLSVGVRVREQTTRGGRRCYQELG